ncbi:MAG: DUF3458 domain-containing protein, partial [Pseudobdellovibrionaceae bacterium]
PESAMAVDNFFTPTIYEKGSEVIRMIQTLIGRENFKKGMKKYFELFDGNAVTCDDFVKAMEIASGKDLTQFRNWYSQAGTPEVKVEKHYDTGTKTYTLKMSQYCGPTPGQDKKDPFVIPVQMALFAPNGKKLDLQIEGAHFLITKSEAVLWLTEKEQSFSFKNIAEAPTPSLLREFSAPVNLSFGESDQELLFLMKNDDDAFNRFESIQKLALKNISTLIVQLKKGEPLSVNTDYIETYGTILKDNSLDPAIRSLLLMLPGDEAIIANESEIHPEIFDKARKHLKREIAKAHKKSFSEIYDKYHGKETQNFEHWVIGQRRLKNRSLGYLCSLEDETHSSLAYRVFKTAENMTDTVAALSVLKDRLTKERDEAFAFFHDRWKNDSLVMNKWFQIQAESHIEGIVDLVKTLAKNPLFSIKTPAQVYSLYRTFGYSLLGFNDPSGKGYELMANAILEVDPINPQVAARLCSCFRVLCKLPSHLKTLLKKEIARILENPNLSPNTRELVEKASRF